MPPIIVRGTSVARSASPDRGRDRKEIPNSLTNVARANPRVSAKAMLAKPIETCSAWLGTWYDESSACIVSHSLTNPLSGGRPAMAMDPTRKNAAVHGILFASPPIRFMSALPVLATTDPAPMNRSPLKTAWLSEWYMLASSARAARVASPYDMKTTVSPRPRTMIPMFSTLWYARARLMSCSTAA